MRDVLLAGSILVNMVYILSMIYSFYLVVMAESRSHLRKIIRVTKIPLVAAAIALILHIFLGDLTAALGDLLKVAGPMAIAWSSMVRIKVMPMTEAERFETEALRDLNKL